MDFCVKKSSDTFNIRSALMCKVLRSRLYCVDKIKFQLSVTQSELTIWSRIIDCIAFKQKSGSVSGESGVISYHLSNLFPP